MKLAFVPFVALAVSFTFAATPTATIDPSTNYFKIDMTRPPPPPTQVYVVNFPDTQAVSGTVSIGNFPAVQYVGGSVNVGNLPLDAEGAVRVTGECPTTTPLQAQYVNLLPGGPLTLGSREVTFTEPVDARGFSRIGIVGNGNSVGVWVEWTWSNLDPLFGRVQDPRNGGLQTACSEFSLNTGAEVKEVCVVSGEQVHLRIECWADSCRVPLAGVYLIP